MAPVSMNSEQINRTLLLCNISTNRHFSCTYLCYVLYQNSNARQKKMAEFYQLIRRCLTFFYTCASFLFYALCLQHCKSTSTVCFPVQKRPDVRACILVQGVRSDVWAKHSGRDLTTVVIYFNSKEGIERRFVV